MTSGDSGGEGPHYHEMIGKTLSGLAVENLKKNTKILEY